MDDAPFISRRKLFEQVAAHIERQILSGALKPGDRLPPERDLQATFGVGRPAVREALITLQRSGLIEIGNGAPARVAMPTIEGIVAGLTPAVSQILSGVEGHRQLQGVRLFMEVGLVRNAAANATPEELARLKAALEDNRRAVGNRSEFIRTDVAFHYTLAVLMHNTAFLAMHDAMSTWLTDLRRIALLEENEDRAGVEGHQQIYEAVAARDPDAAEKAMRTHLEAGAAAFWRSYAQTAQPRIDP